MAWILPRKSFKPYGLKFFYNAYYRQRAQLLQKRNGNKPSWPTISDPPLTSAFASAEKRGELLYALQHAGFQVRMHSHEYFIRRGKFVSIVVLSPTLNKAKIKLIGWNLKDSTESAKEIEIILKGLDKGVKIDTS